MQHVPIFMQLADQNNGGTDDLAFTGQNLQNVAHIRGLTNFKGSDSSGYLLSSNSVVLACYI